MDIFDHVIHFYFQNCVFQRNNKNNYHTFSKKYMMFDNCFLKRCL